MASDCTQIIMMSGNNVGIYLFTQKVTGIFLKGELISGFVCIKVEIFSSSLKISILCFFHIFSVLFIFTRMLHFLLFPFKREAIYTSRRRYVGSLLFSWLLNSMNCRRPFWYLRRVSLLNWIDSKFRYCLFNTPNTNRAPVKGAVMIFVVQILQPKQKMVSTMKIKISRKHSPTQNMVSASTFMFVKCS